MDPALLWIAATLLVALGVVGVVLPGLPGIPLVLVGLVVGAWIDDFAYVGRGTLMVIAPARAARDGGRVRGERARREARRRASPRGDRRGARRARRDLLRAARTPDRAVRGAVIGEFSARGNLARAGRVGLATWLGLLLGGAAKLALVISMIAVFALQRFA